MAWTEQIYLPLTGRGLTHQRRSTIAVTGIFAGLATGANLTRTYFELKIKDDSIILNNISVGWK